MLKVLEKPLFRALILCFFVTSLIIFTKSLFFGYYQDFFRSYYHSALVLKEGNNPYIEGEDQLLSPFVYPPSALPLFIPFTYLSPVLAGRIFALISLLAYFFSMYLLIKIVGSKPFSSLALLLYALGFSFFPAKFTMGMGQVNNVILLLMVLFLYFKKQNREVLSGLVLAFAIAIKIFPVILLFGLLVEKEWKIIFSCLWALVILTIYPLLIFDRSTYLYFFSNIITRFSTATPAEYYNQSLSAFLVRLTNNIGLSLAIRNVAIAASTLLFVKISQKFKSTKNNSKEMLYAYLIVLGLLLNGVSWQHHFVWLTIPFFITFSYLRKYKFSWKLYFLLLISFTLTASNIKDPTNIPPIFLSHVAYGSFLLFIVVSYVVINSPPNKKRLFNSP